MGVEGRFRILCLVWIDSAGAMSSRDGFLHAIGIGAQYSFAMHFVAMWCLHVPMAIGSLVSVSMSALPGWIVVAWYVAVFAMSAAYTYASAVLTFVLNSNPRQEAPGRIPCLNNKWSIIQSEGIGGDVTCQTGM